VSVVDIKAGEEIFCSYGYKFDDSPLWYRKLLVDHLEKNPDSFGLLEILRNNHTIDEMKEDIIDQEEYLQQINIEKRSL